MVLRSKHLWITVGLLATTILTLAACQSIPKPAVMYRGGPQRTGLYDTQSVPELSGVKWRFETGGGIWPSPVVADGVVYVGSDDDHLYAVDTESGEQVWRFQTGDDVHSSPAIADGVVYFGGGISKNVYAVDTQTGEELWHFTTEGAVHSTPVVDNGVVYVGSLDGCLHALN